jgi:mannose-6-phosphate isomerase-like protein (cupin superfamily)
MRILVPLSWCLLILAVPSHAVQQRSRTTSTTIAVSVTDGTGAPIEGATVRATGPVSRRAETSEKGTVQFSGARAGEYRLRAEKEGYVILERMVTVSKAPVTAEMSLSEAPAPPAAPPPPEAPPAAPPPAAPAGEASSIVVVDFVERHFIRTRDDQQYDELGCTASAKTSLIQVREPLEDRVLPDADEVLYVVAGEGTLRLGNRNVSLKATTLAVVPRGTARGLTRRGRNPLILISVVSGPPCTN